MTEFYICVKSDDRFPNFEVWDGPFPSMAKMKASDSYKEISEQLDTGDEVVKDFFYLKLQPGKMPYIREF